MPASCKSKLDRSCPEQPSTLKPCATASRSSIRSRWKRWGKVTETTKAPTPSHGKPRWGLGLGDLTPDVRQQLRAAEDVHGAVIEQVAPGSSADNAGLQQGEVITEVNRQSVNSAADVQKELSSVPKGSDALSAWSGPAQEAPSASCIPHKARQAFRFEARAVRPRLNFLKSGYGWSRKSSSQLGEWADLLPLPAAIVSMSVIACFHQLAGTSSPYNPSNGFPGHT